MMSIRLKRAYDQAEDADGTRILVDGMWPRGVSKNTAQIDLWLKAIAPSTELRRWFGHRLERWEEFQKKYFQELEANPGPVNTLLQEVHKAQTITLIYAAKDRDHNNAVVLKEFLTQKLD